VRHFTFALIVVNLFLIGMNGQ